MSMRKLEITRGDDYIQFGAYGEEPALLIEMETDKGDPTGDVTMHLKLTTEFILTLPQIEQLIRFITTTPSSPPQRVEPGA